MTQIGLSGDLIYAFLPYCCNKNGCLGWALPAHNRSGAGDEFADFFLFFLTICQSEFIFMINS